MPRAFRLEAVKKFLEHSKRRSRQQCNAAESCWECGHLLPFDHTAYCVAAALFRAMAAAEQRETFAAHVCHATGGSAAHAADENYWEIGVLN